MYEAPRLLRSARARNACEVAGGGAAGDAAGALEVSAVDPQSKVVLYK